MYPTHIQRTPVSIRDQHSQKEERIQRMSISPKKENGQAKKKRNTARNTKKLLLKISSRRKQ